MNKITDYRKDADENQSKFATAFKEFYQVLPTEYRKFTGISQQPPCHSCVLNKSHKKNS